MINTNSISLDATMPESASLKGIAAPDQLKEPKLSNVGSQLSGALGWLRFGFRVIPLVPGQKRPALPYCPWLTNVSVETIEEHWRQNPTHEVGAVLDHTHLVLDADSVEADEALRRLEDQFGVVPSMIIKTRRGHHHHFRLAEGTFAKADSHSSVEYPDRIDIRAENSSVMLTPSTGKSVVRLDTNRRDELSPVGQDFIDAVFQHNGKAAPRPLPDEPEERDVRGTGDIGMVSAFLEHIDPDCGYQEWLNVLMAIFHETEGSDAGLELADSWSRKASSYKSRADIEIKWRSFRGDVSNPITIATLAARARDAGADITSITQEGFQRCDTVVVRAPEPAPAERASKASASPLARYSLIGQAAKYEAMAQAANPLLGNVCYRGEATVWYARHNTGKTLLFLHMASEAVEQGRLIASDLFFINADDSSAGVAVKLNLLDELGAHTLVPGQSGFKPEKLEELLLGAVQNDTARGTLVVIDTLKKFVDLMNKRQASEFANVCRQFVASGGTLLGLAHVNKRKNDNGKVIHAGTTDILDDFDAGYIIDELDISGHPGQKFVEFTREKARGGGIASVAYTYAAEDNVSYAERLASVRLVDQDDLDGIKQVEAQRADAELIAVVAGCIAQGVKQKMDLRNAVAVEAKISRRAAIQIIEKYTGDDPEQHRWNFVLRARGAKAYELLIKDAPALG